MIYLFRNLECKISARPLINLSCCLMVNFSWRRQFLVAFFKGEERIILNNARLVLESRVKRGTNFRPIRGILIPMVKHFF